MKLATLKDGTRDGKLVVVSRDLTQYTDASFLARTLQAALDDWRRISPHLATIAESLENNAVPSARFHEHDAHSPLPRAYQWADGSAYVNHVELVRKARGVEMPASFWTDPLIYHAQLGDAGIAGAARRHRLAGAAVQLVGDGARANDGAGGKRSCPGGMGNQRREIEGHVDAGIGAAEGLAVEIGKQRQADLAAVPGIAQFIGGHRDR